MKSKQITTAAITAALYVILTYAARLFNLDSGIIQVRFSEALCILPCFSAAAVPGLFIGCLLSNVLVANAFWDVIFGSIATLIGAYFTHKLRSRPVLAVIPPILSNTIIIPFILSYVYKHCGQGGFESESHAAQHDRKGLHCERYYAGDGYLRADCDERSRQS